jgi:hypothetical protein
MCIASGPRKLNIAPISIQQQSVHRIGVNAPRKKKAASTARPAKAHCDEITSPRGNAIMSSIAAAVSLSKASAMPAPPVGNMEKSLCIAKTLTTSSKLDKREKGAQEATLLRGETGSCPGIFSKSRKSDSPWHRRGFRIGQPAGAVFRAGQGSPLGPGRVPRREGEKSWVTNSRSECLP